jgi:predicted N-formylglutamate amidohydrolase
VLHFAVHSFTPVLRGETRAKDVGLHYDPSRGPERSAAIAWQRQLRESHPDLRVRRNAPYRGNADGLTTALRRERSARRYVGIEIELNQRVVATRDGQRALAAALAALHPVSDAT